MHKPAYEPLEASDCLTRAGDFVLRYGDLLERRLFEAVFRGGSSEAVIEALHGPAEFILQVLDTIDAVEPRHLASLLDVDEFGSVAACGQEGVGARGIGMVGLLRKHEVWYPWLMGATQLCWDAIEAYLEPPVGSGGRPPEAAEIWPMLVFLGHADRRESADRLLQRLGTVILEWDLVRFDPTERSVERTPLDWAPSPWSPCRPLFTDEQIERHLAVLLAEQRSDGGWPATDRSRSWRTIEALRTLRAYGALDGRSHCLPASHPDFL